MSPISRPRPALRVRLATAADLDAVAAFLARSLSGEGGPARYRRFFEYSWLADKPNLGALIEDVSGGGPGATSSGQPDVTTSGQPGATSGGSEPAARIGGFLGAIYSRRAIGGQLQTICNLTSWAVDEPYRRASLGMLKCLLDQPSVTFTTFSASPAAAEILRFLKFQTLRSDKLLFSLASGLRARAAALIGRATGRLGRGAGAARSEPLRVIDGAEQVAPLLEADHRQILDDHRPYHCGHLLIERGSRRCYAVTVARGRGRRRFADVLYASDPGLFVEAAGAVQGALFRAHRTLLAGIDLRWVERPPPLAVCYTALRPAMFRTDSVDPRDICALHSELVTTHG